jgi:hypothetical protein
MPLYYIHPTYVLSPPGGGGGGGCNGEELALFSRPMYTAHWNLYIYTVLQGYLGTNLCNPYIKITARDFALIVKLVKSFVITVICQRKGSL